MIKTRVGGKLFIAGEYAITEPGNLAILIGVDKYITLTLEKSPSKGSIKIYDEEAMFWDRKEGTMIFETFDNRLGYILAGINIVEEYARELKIDLSKFHIKVETELESAEGNKYGLGSSGAVTIATTKALCEYYNIPVTKEELFKLSALANLAINPNSSCGDLAASIYGGWVIYKSFDRDWLLVKQKENSIKDLLAKEWKHLSIENLDPPEGLNLAIGWTGSPASTVSLVGEINKRKLELEKVYNEFLKRSKDCLKNMMAAFQNKDVREIQRQIKVNRELLVDLGKNFGVEIETEKLKILSNLALKHGGSAKSSGAGGGDCGIAVFEGEKNLDELIEDWRKEGIHYLPLKPTRII